MVLLNKPITAKLGLRFGAMQTSDPLYLGNTIIPTTDADKVTRQLKIYTSNVAITSTGVKTGLFEVPLNKRWIPISISAFNLDGTYTITSNKVSFNRVSDTLLLRQDTTDTGTNTDTILLRDFDIELEAKDNIVYQHSVSVKSVNGNITQNLLVYETDLN